ncbi:site-specific integrase [Dietzia sp. WMMA184]|uniref:site-specific integrase n=1 Tax=Dietzia sp. WMMA184 TaxID=2039808 RepID=UPI000BDEBBD6|nr:site-specific integrase [Dietzia sp. WMMA184]
MTTTGGGFVAPYQTKTQGRLWEARWRDDANASKRKKGFKTKRSAQEWLAQNRTQRVQGTYVDPQAGRVTVGALWPSYEASMASLKGTTRAYRDSFWRNHVEPRWGAVEVGRIRPSMIRTWVSELVVQDLGASGIEKCLEVLRGILALAHEDRLLNSNPAMGVKAPRRTPRPQRFLSHDQVDALAYECGKDGLVVQMLAYTGLRSGELAALRVGDVDFLRRRISVARSLSYARGQGYVESATKTYEVRSVPLAQFLVEPLSVQAQGRGPDDFLIGPAPDEFLKFPAWRPRVFTPAVKRCRQADPMFAAVTIHDLRHTAASLAVQAGGNLLAVSRLLGHASPEITAKVYLGLFPSDLDALVDGLDAARASSVRPRPQQVGG